MKVRVTLSVEVDVEAWSLTYGNPVREDVVEYVLEQVRGSAAADEGCIIRVERKV